MTLSTELGIAVLLNIASISVGIGIFVNKVNTIKDTVKDIKTDLKEDIMRLEGKQDKYNSLQERTALNEQSTRSAHHRIDEHIIHSHAAQDPRIKE